MTNLREVAAFLLGEGELDGVGFGDPHPTERGNYWWRKHLRAALAQPEQEPVAWTTDIEFDRDTEVIPAKEKGKLGTSMVDIPLYTVPPKIFCGCGDQIMPDDGAECGTCVTARNAVKEWVGLTEDEVQQLFGVGKVDATFMEFTRAIEAKLKEKNT